MIRRFFARILMLALLAACGYNIWQVHQMQGELVRLRRQMTALSRPAPPLRRAAEKDADTQDSAHSWLDRASRDAQAARAALARGDFALAQREGTRGLDAVRQAAQEPEAKTQATLQSLRRTLTTMQAQAQTLQAQADALWRKAHSAPINAAPHAAVP